MCCLPVLFLNQGQELGELDQMQEMAQDIQPEAEDVTCTSSSNFDEFVAVAATMHHNETAEASVRPHNPIQQQQTVGGKRARPSSPETGPDRVIILPSDGEGSGPPSPAQHMSHHHAVSFNGFSGGGEEVRDYTCAHIQQMFV